MRFSSILRRVQRLEPEPEYAEPWPPEEGSLSWAILEGRKAEGLETPTKPAGESGFMFLARLKAPRLWGDCHASD
jgi:hypothetical protein